VPRTSTLSPYYLLKLAAYKLSVVTVARETEVKWFSHNKDLFIKRVACARCQRKPVAWDPLRGNRNDFYDYSHITSKGPQKLAALSPY
jgi:hypothetical protein